MKKTVVFLLFSSLIISCTGLVQNQTGVILSMDEKSERVKSHLDAYMKNDSSIAENLFAENLELYDQFSNNQEDGKTKANPGGNQGLIEADKFAHVLFSDIQLTTDNIKTYVTDDGKVYTAFWSMWSGKGNFTGRNTTLPFYCISLWEENQISKIWRYMDPTAFNEEITAFEGINKNSTKALGLAELGVNKGYSKKDVEDFLVRFSKFVRATEPNTYDFGYFISADGKSVNLVEKYYDPADFVFHLNNFEGNDISKEFLSVFTIKKVIIAGAVSDELKAKAEAYGAEVRSQIGGWID